MIIIQYYAHKFKLFEFANSNWVNSTNYHGNEFIVSFAVGKLLSAAVKHLASYLLTQWLCKKTIVNCDGEELSDPAPMEFGIRHNLQKYQQAAIYIISVKRNVNLPEKIIFFGAIVKIPERINSIPVVRNRFSILRNRI